MSLRPRLWQTNWTGYGIAVASVALMFFLRGTILDHLLGYRAGIILFLLPVMLSAWYAGLGPGLLATGLSGLLADFFLMEPRFSLTISDASDRVRLAVFLVEGIGISLLCHNLHRAHRRAKRRGERVEESEARVRSLLDSTAEAIVGGDARGHCTFVNPACVRMMGYAHAGELIGRNIDEIFRVVGRQGQTFPPHCCPILRAFADGRGIHAEDELFCRKDGTTLPVEYWSYPIVRDGRPTGLVVTFVDVSDRKRAEVEREQLLAREQSTRTEAEAANRAKDEFLATVSHELRTPLTAMLAWSNLLRNTPYEPELMAEGLDAMERSAKAQAELVEDILDVSRIITGKLRLNMRALDLAGVIDDAVDTVRAGADAKGVHLRAVYEPVVAVAADADRLRQVVWNLVSNAIKFTPEGGEVVVRLSQEHSRARISVSDTGAGIAPDFLPHVFDRFRQADGTTTRRHGGLGLGLAIVRHVVEMHGGTVSAHSEGEGRGSEFIVELPVPAIPPESPVPPVRYGAPGGNGDEVAASSSLAGVEVVVVDDEPDARRVIETVLQHCGAHVVPAASAAEALDRLAAPHHTPQVLVSDIGMPGEDGYTLIRKLRAMEDRDHVPRTPAAALTAYTRSEDRARTLAAGYNVYVPKPVAPRDLAMIVAGLAGRR